ncbi:MAG: energy transducer TonB [Opitutaceae bacterium]|nr:energy transducer TonB [Opitutaceae bacterium]
MKRIDLIVGILVSVGIHGGVLGGGELFGSGKKKVVVAAADPQVIAALIDFAPPEEEKLPDEAEVVTDNKDTSDSDDGADAGAAALPEPMNTIGVSDITTVIKPSAPVAPRSDSVSWSPPSKQTRSIDSSKFKEFVDFAKLDKIPKARQQIAPRYPFELKRQGVSGECTVQFFVDEKGMVLDPIVVSSTHREFEKPSLDAVAQWRFSPGMKNGRAVATRMQQPIPFNIAN